MAEFNPNDYVYEDDPDEDKVLNPSTGRYIRKSSTLGRKILSGYIPEKKERKKKEYKKKDVFNDAVEGDKILNPTTGRYVKATSALGRKIAKGFIPPQKKSKVKDDKGNCNDPDKIENPKTKRCVKRTGKIGQEIIKSENRKLDATKRLQAVLQRKNVELINNKKLNIVKKLQSRVRKNINPKAVYVSSPVNIQAALKRSLAQKKYIKDIQFERKLNNDDELLMRRAKLIEDMRKKKSLF